jgi:hypothetical protein
MLPSKIWSWELVAANSANPCQRPKPPTEPRFEVGASGVTATKNGVFRSLQKARWPTITRARASAMLAGGTLQSAGRTATLRRAPGMGRVSNVRSRPPISIPSKTFCTVIGWPAAPWSRLEAAFQAFGNGPHSKAAGASSRPRGVTKMKPGAMNQSGRSIGPFRGGLSSGGSGG